MNNNLFDKLAAEENKFFSSEFLSPVLTNQPIRVRIAGIVVNLKVSTPKNFQGWGIFSPISHKEAKFIKDPSMSEKKRYLDLFPTLRFIICRRTDEIWQGIPAHQSDTRFKITGLVPIHLMEGIQLFDVVQTRFDGVNCWFEDIDSKHSLKTANYLRECLNKLLEPDKIDILGLTQEEKDAYLMAYGPALEADIEAKKDKNEERIKKALNIAGAVYRSYIERGNTYTIEYTVGRENHRSVINKNNFQIQSAGICLSGGDRAFDLTSLVGVIKEGQRRHRIVRTDGHGDYL